MKRLVFFLAFMGLTGSQIDAQFNSRNRQDRLIEFDEQKYSWGFTLSGNRFGYSMVMHPRFGNREGRDLVRSKDTYGFGAGLIGRMRINEHLDLRLEPSLHFVQRELYFDTQSNDIFQNGTLDNPAFTPISLTEASKIRNVKQTYIDIPLLVEFHGERWYNTRAYIAGGLNYLVNLQSNANNVDDNLQGVWRNTTHNFGYSAEAGIQIYFSKFKLTPAVRGTFAFNNELVSDKADTPPYWADALTSVKTRAIFLVLKFE